MDKYLKRLSIQFTIYEDKYIDNYFKFNVSDSIDTALTFPPKYFLPYQSYTQLSVNATVYARHYKSLRLVETVPLAVNGTVDCAEMKLSLWMNGELVEAEISASASVVSIFILE